jgi:hypothetical protein
MLIALNGQVATLANTREWPVMTRSGEIADSRQKKAYNG